MNTLLIRNGTIVRSGGLENVDIRIVDRVIEQIGNDLPDANEVLDATGLLVMPGLIDGHVHFREPGYEHKATMKTEAAAARAGGVLTVCEMPNTNPPAVTISALEGKVKRAATVTDADIRFFFGITEKKHIDELKRLCGNAEYEKLRARCCGVKIYLEHSTGNQRIDPLLLQDIFAVCTQQQLTLVAHCEDPATIDVAMKRVDASKVLSHSFARPPEAEARAIDEAIGLAARHGTHLHIAHLSTREGTALVRDAKEKGVHVTCEAAPHHLFLSIDDYETLGTYGKMNPPLRTKEHQEALWRGIADRTIDMIATDHAPHTKKEKENADPSKAPSGVPGVETMLPLLLSTKNILAARSSQLAAADIYRLCFENPNQIFHLKKQGIAEGAPASVVLVDPEAEWQIHAADLHSKCGWTPYEGWNVKGKVMRVID